MFAEQVDIHIAQAKRSNRGVKRHENRSGDPKVRGPEKTGPFGAAHPARTTSISARRREGMEHEEHEDGTWEASCKQQEQHELHQLLVCWAGQPSHHRPPPPHGSTIAD